MKVICYSMNRFQESNIGWKREGD